MAQELTPHEMSLPERAQINDMDLAIELQTMSRELELDAYIIARSWLWLATSILKSSIENGGVIFARRKSTGLPAPSPLEILTQHIMEDKKPSGILIKQSEELENGAVFKTLIHRSARLRIGLTDELNSIIDSFSKHFARTPEQLIQGELWGMLEMTMDEKNEGTIITGTRSKEEHTLSLLDRSEYK